VISTVWAGDGVRSGTCAVAVSPFKAFAACAGAFRVNRWRFLGVLAAGRILRYSGLAYLRVKLGTVDDFKACSRVRSLCRSVPSRVSP
jgi:hypothetical protein